MEKDKLTFRDPKELTARIIKADILLAETNENGESEPILEGFEVDGQLVSVVRNFEKNNSNEAVSARIVRQTGLSGPALQAAFDNEMLSTGESDDIYIAEHNKDPTNIFRDEHIEYLFVKATEVNGQKGESALVVMYKYGLLKQMYFPSGDSGDQIPYEAYLCVANKMTVIVPMKCEEIDGVLVSTGDNVKIDLNQGDALVLPLIPRQVFNGGEFTDKPTINSLVYLLISAEWQTEKGVDMKPVYYPEQVKRG